MKINSDKPTYEANETAYIKATDINKQNDIGEMIGILDKKITESTSL